MVAISSSRRRLPKNVAPKQITVEGLTQCGPRGCQSLFEAGASRRGVPSVEIFRDGQNGITQVRIGRWRNLTAGPQRRLAEVRELDCQRVAVRIERFADNGQRPTSEIWQLYDLEGRLEAALQSSPDGAFALLTNYATREACRLVRNRNGDLETVETWRI
jgi:hypothetical protein